MKKLSDYKGEEALALWARLLDPLVEILSDKDTREMIQSKNPPVVKAKTVIEKHSAAAEKLLLAIDETPIDGLNVVLRLVEVFKEIGSNEQVRDFFSFAPEATEQKKSFGSATENTEESPNTSSDM